MSVWAGEIVVLAAAAAAAKATCGGQPTDSARTHTQRSRGRRTHRFVLVFSLPCSFTRSHGNRRLWLKTPGCATLWTNKVPLRRRLLAFSPIFFYFLAECRGHFGFFFLLPPCDKVTINGTFHRVFVVCQPSEVPAVVETPFALFLSHWVRQLEDVCTGPARSLSGLR